MAGKAPDGAIVTKIQRPSSSFNNTRPGWPNSSFDPVFNRAEGPSAATVFDAPLSQHTPSAPRAPLGEVAEVIGQEILQLGDALHRGKRERPLSAVEAIVEPGSARENSVPSENQGQQPAVAVAVEVEVVGIPSRGGRSRKPEKYPFSVIKVARRVDGAMEGESFFIPDCDHPKRAIAVARKRYGPGMTFDTRTVPGGVRVWRKS